MNLVKYIDLEFKDYKETWDFQQDIQNQLIRAKTAVDGPGGMPCLIFVEHPHVFTLGKSGKENNLLINPGFLASIGAAFYKTDRGGDITYHGPGQLVGYPVIDLDTLGLGVKKYIYCLEESIIQTLEEYGIQSTRLNEATGVWIVPEPPALSRKICAIGVKVSRGITMHGFALNVSTDLNYFNYINPCGFTNKGVTSMTRELGQKPDMAQLKQLLLRKLSEQFQITFN
jgi:lipoyl(octanoyl) transferase